MKRPLKARLLAGFAAMAAVGAIEAALAYHENDFFEFCSTTAYGWPAPWTINYCRCEGGETSHPIAGMAVNLSLIMASGMLGATLGGRGLRRRLTD
jgi:hypothetical protein